MFCWLLKQLTQEKNDLREEKISLKSDIENLNNQYQMRLRASFPWGAMDHSVVMAPYPYPVPMTMPIHPSMQPYPFFPNQNSGAIPNSFSAFMPHVSSNTVVEHRSTQHVPPSMHLATSSHVSNKQDCNHTLTKDGKNERNDDSNNVATDLELKTPGSKSDQVRLLTVCCYWKMKKTNILTVFNLLSGLYISSQEIKESTKEGEYCCRRKFTKYLLISK